MSENTTPQTCLNAVSKATARLQAAAASRRPTAPIRDLIGPLDVRSAYAVQQQLVAHRISTGAKVMGRKIGLTSEAVQEQLGVSQPDLGMLFDDMQVRDGGSLTLDAVLQPRVEAEIAFVLSEDLVQGPFDVEQVRDSIAFAVPSIEICGSRIADWDISLADTVADNASAGAFVLGTSPCSLGDVDTREAQMEMRLDEELVSRGHGALCMGDPLNAVVWLADASLDFGRPLRRGEIILSGALGPMKAVTSPGTVTATISGLGSISVTFIS